MYKVYSNTDIYGLWGSFILKNLTEEKYDFDFNYGINISKVEEDIKEENIIGVIFLGKPIQDNQKNSVEKSLEEVNKLPFTMNYHFANWGEMIDIDVSIVDDEVNYVKRMVEEISKGKGFLKFKDQTSEQFAVELAEGLQSHHEYDGGELGKNLMLLSELYSKNLINREYSNVLDIGNKEKEVIRSLRENMKEYTLKKVEQAEIKVLNSGARVVTLFAEKHVNELGKMFIDSLSKGGFEVIVMIGKQTRGDDLYHVRTSEGVSAQEVAQKLNHGKGKERAATVFLPKGNQAVYNTIVRTLNSANM